MKFIVALIVTALLSFIGCMYFPWWTIAIAAFITALLIHQRSWKAFLAGFIALLLLWGGLAFWIDIKNESILSARISQLMGIGNNPVLLILITGLIGGLVGGFAAMSASFLIARKSS